MKKIVKLTESDLVRIVKKSINEMHGLNQGDVTIAMDMVREYLKKTGGTLGSRKPEDILEALKSLEWAIKLEKNDMEVAMKRPNPEWGKNKMDIDMDMDNDMVKYTDDDMDTMSESRYFRRRR